MQFSHFDLNLLRSLDALLAERNVTRASERLFVTQQAMSGALRRLREHFGNELLVRVGRQMELTPLARSLALPVRETLLKAETALNSQPSFDPATAKGAVRVAMSDYTSLVLLPRLMQVLAAEAPNLTVRVEAYSELTFPRLDSGDLDVCVTVSDRNLYRDYFPSDEIRGEPLFHDDFVCVVDPRHPASRKMSLTAYRSAQHNVVRFGPGIRTLVEKGWEQIGFDAHIAATAPSFATLIYMLPGTQLVATAQRRLATVLAAPLRLQVLKCPIALESLREDLMWHARNDADPAHIYLRAAFRKAAERLDAKG
jgi:LysR family transcriptional regulator, nod-box dependent transcriptional activator